MEVFRTAVALMVRSMVLSAQSAGQRRLLWLQQSAAVGGEVGELARLRASWRAVFQPADPPGRFRDDHPCPLPASQRTRSTTAPAIAVRPATIATV